MSKWILVLLFVGCAQQKLVLKNNEVTPFKEFSKKTLVNEDLGSFSRILVEDMRQEKTYIGEALTGVTFKKTPISLSKPVDAYINDEMGRLLEQRGLQFDESSNVELHLIINELWVDELIEKYQAEKAKCNANMTFSIKSEKSSWSGNYWTKIISPGDLGDGTEKIAATLGSCINEISEKLVNDKSFIKYLKQDKENK